MHALVVYESMYGNTHTIADRIAAGLRTRCETTVVGVGDATPELVEVADLLVVGGPTHAHGLSRPSTRAAAIDKSDAEDHQLDPDAEGDGLREWFELLLEGGGRPAVAFDTRVDGPTVITGRASKGIAKRLQRHHFTLVASPESFLVDRSDHLCDGEADRAESFGAEVAEQVAASTATG